jgi:hypothetical protein
MHRAVFSAGLDFHAGDQFGPRIEINPGEETLRVVPIHLWLAAAFVMPRRSWFWSRS